MILKYKYIILAMLIISTLTAFAFKLKNSKIEKQRIEIITLNELLDVSVQTNIDNNKVIEQIKQINQQCVDSKAQAQDKAIAEQTENEKRISEIKKRYALKKIITVNNDCADIVIDDDIIQLLQR